MNLIIALTSLLGSLNLIFGTADGTFHEGSLSDDGGTLSGITVHYETTFEVIDDYFYKDSDDIEHGLIMEMSADNKSFFFGFITIDENYYNLHFEKYDDININYQFRLGCDYYAPFLQTNYRMYSDYYSCLDHLDFDIFLEYYDVNLTTSIKFFFDFTYLDTTLAEVYWNLTSDNQSSLYYTGYDNGYDRGYENGVATGGADLYNQGFTAGQTIGHIQGYQEGLRDGSDGQADYTFMALFGAIADTPIMILRNLLGFELFGVQAISVLMTMITGCIVLFLIRKII